MRELFSGIGAKLAFTSCLVVGVWRGVSCVFEAWDGWSFGFRAAVVLLLASLDTLPHTCHT
jgi:hypothetical protein